MTFEALGPHVPCEPLERLWSSSTISWRKMAVSVHQPMLACIALKLALKGCITWGLVLAPQFQYHVEFPETSFAWEDSRLSPLIFDLRFGGSPRSGIFGELWIHALYWMTGKDKPNSECLGDCRRNRRPIPGISPLILAGVMWWCVQVACEAGAYKCWLMQGRPTPPHTKPLHNLDCRSERPNTKLP